MASEGFLSKEVKWVRGKITLCCGHIGSLKGLLQWVFKAMRRKWNVKKRKTVKKRRKMEGVHK